MINILTLEDQRPDGKVAEKDLIKVVDTDEDYATIILPDGFTGAKWKPSGPYPIEVIDGQHRLWAFEDPFDEDFELPVVAFHGLDISWQAYLFWTINIRPKRINPSLAFDMYPLLRTEDWLEKFEGHFIYRETRSQELTGALWAHKESPWYHRINMLGEPKLRKKMVSQSAWINTLMASYVKAWEGPGVRVGGLFGAPVGKDETVLPWCGAQQAGFLILMGQKIEKAVRNCNEEWAKALRGKGSKGLSENEEDLAFVGPATLFNADPGVRGILYVTNDLCYVRADALELKDWVMEAGSAADEAKVSEALSDLRSRKVAKFLEEIAKRLVTYDWRTSTAPGLDKEQEERKKVFRGSGGYRILRGHLLEVLGEAPGEVGKASRKVIKALGY
ncbi:hypothetical protein ES703_11750 [subsurface metagenome]|nr:hypothetical protein [bacterium]